MRASCLGGSFNKWLKLIDAHLFCWILKLQGMYWYVKLGSSFVTGIWTYGKLRLLKDIYPVGKSEREGVTWELWA